MEAEIYTALASGGAGWTGIESPDLYHVFMNVSPEYAKSEQRWITFDAVAIIRKQNQLTTHGIEIVGMFNQMLAHKLLAMAPYCDRLWLATHDQAKIEQAGNLPPFVGILYLKHGHIQVTRPATSFEQSGTRLEQMLKGLLTNMLRH